MSKALAFYCPVIYIATGPYPIEDKEYASSQVTMTNRQWIWLRPINCIKATDRQTAKTLSSGSVGILHPKGGEALTPTPPSDPFDKM